MADDVKDMDTTATEAPTNDTAVTTEDLEKRLGNFLSDAAARAEEALAKAEGSTEEAFKCHLDAGSALSGAKASYIGEGGKPADFNKWAEGHVLKASKQWRNRLIQLADNWEKIAPHVEDIPKDKLTVNTAIKAWRDAEKAARGEGEGEGEGESKPKLTASTAKDALADTMQFLRELHAGVRTADPLTLAEIDAALDAHLSNLPPEVVALGEVQEDGPTEDSAPIVEDTPKEDTPKLPAPTKNRVRKLVGMLKDAQAHGASDTEATVMGQLQKVSDKYRISVAALLAL